MTRNTDPTLWFVCKFCKRAFRRRKYLIRHKKQFHPKKNERHHQQTGVVQKGSRERSSSENLIHRNNVLHKEVTRMKEVVVKLEKLNDDLVVQENDKMVTGQSQNLDDDDVVILEETQKLQELGGQQVNNKRKSTKSQEIFSTKGDLVGYLTTLGGYECVACLKYFISTYDLERHQRVHTGKLPFECKLCENSYETKTQLRTHYETTGHFRTNDDDGGGVDDVDQGLSSFSSKIGQLQTKTRTKKDPVVRRRPSMSKKTRNVHRGSGPIRRRFECRYCQKVLHKESGRIIHERIHAGEQSFAF